MWGAGMNIKKTRLDIIKNLDKNCEMLNGLVVILTGDNTRYDYEGFLFQGVFIDPNSKQAKKYAEVNPGWELPVKIRQDCLHPLTPLELLGLCTPQV